MENWIDIEPVSYGVLGEAVKLSVSIGYHQAFSSECVLSFVTASEDGKQLHQGSVKLEGEDYAAWGDDNMYLVEYVCSKLNFQILEK